MRDVVKHGKRGLSPHGVMMVHTPCYTQDFGKGAVLVRHFGTD